MAQWARKFKIVQAKKLVKSNNSKNLWHFKLFRSSKIDFWPFLKLQKMEFAQYFFFREIDLFDFTSFLAWTILNFLARYVMDWDIIFIFFLGLDGSTNIFVKKGDVELHISQIKHESRILVEDGDIIIKMIDTYPVKITIDANQIIPGNMVHNHIVEHIL